MLKTFQDMENKDYCKTALKLISEAEFAKKDGRMRGHDEFWNAISCVQMTPQTKIGLGKVFKLTFSPICHRESRPKKEAKKNPKIKTEDKGAKLRAKFDGPIEYDYRQFGDDDLTLQLKNPQAFCLKQCNKIGYYLQMVHQIEVIRMDVEFYQDETGLVLFYHAHNIWIRCSETKSKLLRSTAVTKYDQSDAHKYRDPKQLVAKAPQSFWQNLHQGYDSLERQTSMKDQLQTFLSNELADHILKSKRDDVNDQEDIIHLLQKVSTRLQERPVKVLDMNLTKVDSLRELRANQGGKIQVGFSVSPGKSKT